MPPLKVRSLIKPPEPKIISLTPCFIFVLRTIVHEDTLTVGITHVEDNVDQTGSLGDLPMDASSRAGRGEIDHKISHSSEEAIESQFTDPGVREKWVYLF